MPGRETESQAELNISRALEPRVSTSPAAAASAPAAQPSVAPPSEMSSPVSTPAPAAVATAAPRLKPLNKTYLLTKDSPVYANPDASSAVVGTVRKAKYVRVTGIAGDYIQVKLKNGVVGFVPIDAAE
jgi:hypothetical protein